MTLFMFDEKGRGLAISDPRKEGKPHFRIIWAKIIKRRRELCRNIKKVKRILQRVIPILQWKEIPFGLQTGGTVSRILNSIGINLFLECLQYTFVNGNLHRNLFYRFLWWEIGIAVGGDYTQQSENINNIATTSDGGETLANSSFWKNGGYKTCVKIRPKSKKKDILHGRPEYRIF